jgi:hypothetical protein
MASQASRLLSPPVLRTKDVSSLKGVEHLAADDLKKT